MGMFLLFHFTGGDWHFGRCSSLNEWRPDRLAGCGGRGGRGGGDSFQIQGESQGRVDEKEEEEEEAAARRALGRASFIHSAPRSVRRSPPMSLYPSLFLARVCRFIQCSGRRDAAPPLALRF